MARFTVYLIPFTNGNGQEGYQPAVYDTELHVTHALYGGVGYSIHGNSEVWQLMDEATVPPIVLSEKKANKSAYSKMQYLNATTWKLSDV